MRRRTSLGSILEKLKFSALIKFRTAAGTGYHSDDSYERPKRNVTMAAFRDAVRDSLESADSPIVAQANRPKSMSNSLARNQVDVDQHSGLRIRCG